MRPLVRTLPLALLLVCTTATGPLPPASAVTHDVTISGSSFGSSLTIAQGSTVRWANQDGLTHSVESKQSFFSSLNLGNGDVFTETPAFQNAGSYGYFCRQHGTGMSGTVKVRMKKSGSPSSGWTVRWSSLASTPDNRTFDVQVDKPGTSGFESFRNNTTTRSANFNPSRSGTYKFRARTDIVGVGSSGYSPVLSVVIS